MLHTLRLLGEVYFALSVGCAPVWINAICKAEYDPNHP